MHEYDIALKRILTRPGSALLQALTGSPTLRWLNVETPLVRNLRVDLLGETPAGELVHIELQSRNDPAFPLRMGEYSFGVALRYGQLPRQVALYVGSEPLRMASEVSGPGGIFRFHLVDIRDLDGEQLLASENLGDNVVAILTRLGRQPDAISRVVRRISAGPPDERERAMAELMIVAGLRKLSDHVRREAKRMPIEEDFMDHDLFGPPFREGFVDLLMTQAEKRFGTVPTGTRDRLEGLPAAELRAAALRILDAQSPEDLFVH